MRKGCFLKYYTGFFLAEPHGLSCALDWKHLSESYVMCIFTFIYVIPVLLITYCYTAIIITVRNSKNRIAAHNSAMESYLTKVWFMIFTARIRSCGNVMFSVVSICLEECPRMTTADLLKPVHLGILEPCSNVFTCSAMHQLERGLLAFDWKSFLFLIFLIQYRSFKNKARYFV